MKALYAVLCTILVTGLAALMVPLKHEVLLTTNKTLLGYHVAEGSTYKVEYRATLAEYLDLSQAPVEILKGVDCNPQSIRAAYQAVGFRDVKVTEINLKTPAMLLDA